MEDKPMKATLEEQRTAALEHYKEASNTIHCWSSFVENAIKHYNPEAIEVTYHNGTEVDVTVTDTLVGLKVDTIKKIKEAILDCWDLLKPQPSSIAPLKSYPNIYNQELLNNQAELINQLREIIEPLAEEIKNNEN